jgi:CheY-like chemotaxis protein
MITETALLQVLFVEDDLADVALMRNAFDEHHTGSQLHHVVDGIEALVFLRRERPYAQVPRPDLILLDLNMPRVDGRQVLTEIKNDDELKVIPVVVFTTSVADSDIVSSYTAHANAYVTKPIGLDDFTRVVADIRDFFGHIVALPRDTTEPVRHDGATDAGHRGGPVQRGAPPGTGPG